MKIFLYGEINERSFSNPTPGVDPQATPLSRNRKSVSGSRKTSYRKI